MNISIFGKMHSRTIMVIQLHFVLTLAIVIWSFFSKIPVIVSVEMLAFLLPFVVLVAFIVECSQRGNCTYLSSFIIFLYLLICVLFTLLQSDRRHTLVLPMPS